MVIDILETDGIIYIRRCNWVHYLTNDGYYDEAFWYQGV